VIDPTARVHPLAFVDEGAEVGPGVVIWQFASVLRGVRLDQNVSIGAGSEIGAHSVVGAGSRISAQVFLPSRSWIGKNVFIGPGAKFADDKYPRANNAKYHAQPPLIEDNAVIGMGAIILPGLKIGENATIAAGAILTKDARKDAHFRGDAAKETERPKVHHTEHHEVVAPSVIAANKNDSHLLPT
jgi:UDP-2-acetamido-3-amino-2,3-dideoxy-glucuronate N-acetyltransferase